MAEATGGFYERLAKRGENMTQLEATIVFLCRLSKEERHELLQILDWADGQVERDKAIAQKKMRRRLIALEIFRQALDNKIYDKYSVDKAEIVQLLEWGREIDSIKAELGKKGPPPHGRAGKIRRVPAKSKGVLRTSKPARKKKDKK